jgi:hypothetical protein
MSDSAYQHLNDSWVESLCNYPPNKYDPPNAQAENDLIAHTQSAAEQTIARLDGSNVANYNPTVCEISLAIAGTMRSMLQIPFREAFCASKYRAFSRRIALEALCRLPISMWWVCGSVESGFSHACAIYNRNVLVLDSQAVSIPPPAPFAALPHSTPNRARSTVPYSSHYSPACPSASASAPPLASPYLQCLAGQYRRHHDRDPSLSYPNAPPSGNNSSIDRGKSRGRGVSVSAGVGVGVGGDKGMGGCASGEITIAKHAAMQAVNREETRITLEQVVKEGEVAVIRELESICEPWHATQTSATGSFEDATRKLAAAHNTCLQTLSNYERKLMYHGTAGAECVKCINEFKSIYCVLANLVTEANDAADAAVAMHQALFLWEAVLTKIPQ